MVSTRLITLSIVFAALAFPAFAQNLPPLLTPAPQFVHPPPPVAPAPVPSAVTPLPQPSYGVPSNIDRGPVISGGGGTVRSIYRGSDGYSTPKKKRRKMQRRPRVSSH
jgi:hypothetical protein